MRLLCVLMLFAALTLPLTPAAGQDLSGAALQYQQHCARCHGVNYMGGLAKSFLDGIWQYGAKSSYMRRNIKHGITQLGMPAFEKTLSDAEIDGLANHLLEIQGMAGVVKPPPPIELQTLEYTVKVDIVVEGLEVPWAIDFLDAKTMLITERAGRLRVVRDGKLGPDPVSGTPEVLHEGQGGLLDVAVDPNYGDNGWVYLAYSHELKDAVGRGKNPAMTRIVRGRLKGNAWADEEVVYEAPREAYLTTRHHYGCRIVFGPAGHLYFSIGERGVQDHAQNLGRPNGKVHRIYPDGRVPKDNPFVNRSGALATIYTYGNRNPQGLAVHPETGRVWETEHGPMGGDELNLVRPGLNYGWPVATYGRNYNGRPVSEFTRKPGLEQPMLYWRPSTGTCGLDFYRGDEFPKWRNRLLVGSLKYEELRLLNIEKDRVMHQEVVLKNAGRVRDVACGPDGAIYVVLNAPGMVLRLTRIEERQY